LDLTCLPATLHNRPERIPGAVRARIRRARAAGREQLFVAYADCGTGGLLDRVLDEEGVARLEGAHCYEVYAGRAAFEALAEEEPGTFYLTDFLARNFDRLVIRGLGLDRHPELLPLYFGNYTRVLYLAQTDDPALTAAARRGARRLGLRFERRFTGYGELAPALDVVGAGDASGLARSAPTRSAPTRSAPTRSAPMRSAPMRSAPDRTSLASDASNRRLTSAPARGSVRSLQPTQGIDHLAAQGASPLSAPRRTVARRRDSVGYVRSTQGRHGSLRVAQEVGASTPAPSRGIP
jgi:hypothetical protein